MRGTIGEDYSGNYIATEIDYYDQNGDSDVIDLYINSFGGGVEDANSVMAAMHTSKKKINTYNMGICASSAFQIFLTGDKLYALDYAKFMCHDPHVSNGKTIEQMEEGSVKNALIAIRDQIATIISNRTGMDKEDVLKLMKAETWFSADPNDVNSLQNVFGLSISTISTKRKPKLKKNSTILDFVNIISNFNPEIDSEESEQKIDNMANLKGILNALDLNEDVANPETKIENKIKDLHSEVATKQTTITEKEKEITNLKKEVQDFKDKEKKESEKTAEAYADQLVSKGLVKEDGKQDVIDLYILDPEKVQNLYGKHNLVKITDVVDGQMPGRDGKELKLETFKNDAGETVTKDMEWYGENDPELLDQMESEAKSGKDTEGAKKFKALYLKEYGENFDSVSKEEVSTTKQD